MAVSSSMDQKQRAAFSPRAALEKDQVPVAATWDPKGTYLASKQKDLNFFL